MSRGDLALSVKSMAGERLERAELSEMGVAGDRVAAMTTRSNRDRAGLRVCCDCAARSAPTGIRSSTVALAFT